MLEAKLQAQLIGGFTRLGWWVDKIPDLAKGVTKPFDLFGSACGKAIAIEAKLGRVYRKRDAKIRSTDLVVQMKEFSAKQIPNLQKFERSQGLAFGALGLKVEGCILAQGELRAWLVPITWLLVQQEWRVEELDPRCQLIWQPGVGWFPTEELKAYCEGRLKL